jgi:hypothetical protein
MDMLWSTVLTAVIGIIGFVLRYYAAELQRVQVLLNKTREEMAKEYVTKAEVHADINRVLDRIERLDLKLDRLIESQQWDGTTERRSR